MTSINGHVKLKNGDIIKINEIRSFFPFSLIKISHRHQALCDFVSSYVIKDNELKRQVYANLLFLKSETMKIVTALSFIDEQSSIVEIESNIITSIFSDVFPNSVIKSASSTSNFLTNISPITMFSKYVINRLFRIFKRNVKGKSYIRSWVEVSEKLYSSEFSKSTIFVYPFSLNIRRAWPYYKFLFRNYKKRSTLMGIPYRPKYILSVLLDRQNHDMCILNFEYEAYKNHVRDFNSCTQVFTTDEFEAASPVLHFFLMQQDCHITNKAHGIGTYNMYVYYSKFFVLNELQKQFYLERNSCKLILAPEQSAQKVILKKEDSFCLVLIDQGDFTRLGLLFEDRLQQVLYAEAENIGTENNLDVFIKVHPNRNKKSIDQLRRRYPNLKIINKAGSWGKGQPIFVNMYSTIYLEWRHFGKFYFIKDGFFDPSRYFGEINLTTIDELNEKIKSEIL